MNVVDSSGWVEYFIDGPNASFFAPPIEDTRNLVVSVISLYEVFKKTLQDQGEGEALKAVAQMKQGRIYDLDEGLALSAAKLSLQLKLPMADSMILAVARAHRAMLWTQDEHFRKMEGVRYIAQKMKERH